MRELVVTRLLQDPLGALTPEGERGDIVRVSAGDATIYLDPDEFDDLDEDTMRVMLSKVVPRCTPTPGWVPSPRPACPPRTLPQAG
jgi:hypothetical protein